MPRLCGFSYGCRVSLQVRVHVRPNILVSPLVYHISAEYGAWNLKGTDSLLMVSQPGGGISAFPE